MTEIQTSIVPCNGCVTCCKKDNIFLMPEHGDDPTQYVTEPSRHPLSGVEGVMIAHKENGDCYYLGETGCTIYDKRPACCRAYDCRKNFLSFTKRMREGFDKYGLGRTETFEEGKKRQWTLTHEERQECIEIRKKRANRPGGYDGTQNA